ncbi:Der1-like family-domain-containing protein [Chytriomyces sp. MP71]|nr:Der1-like family-domain-containing protein [Chytriomyces sp. MP71]
MTPLEEWYFELPIVTRTYMTLVFAETLACQLDLISQYQLYFSPELVFRGGQYWRLITSFLYFGGFSIDFMFHMFFLVRYSRTLEEGYFRGRTADFAWMFVLSMTAIIIITPLVALKSNSVPFLSSPLTFTLIYLWSRKNPHMRLQFFGLFVISAAYLPWVFLGFSLILHGVWPTSDFVGLIVGHVYYFLDDVWPRGGGGSAGNGFAERPRVVRAPQLIKRLFSIGIRGGVDAALPQDFDAVGVTDVPVVADNANPVPGATGEYEVWNGGAEEGTENEPHGVPERRNAGGTDDDE